MHRDFAGLGAKHVALHTDKVTYVEQLLEHYVIEVLVLAGAYLVAADVYLYTATRVLKLHKGGFAHDTAAHHTTGHSHFASGGVVFKIFFDFNRIAAHGVFGCGIRLYATTAHLLETCATYSFLFTELWCVHIYLLNVCMVRFLVFFLTNVSANLRIFFSA